MLSSTRQACVRRLTSSLPLSFPPALPAESSRQAILRAAASTVAPTRQVSSETRRNTKEGVSSIRKSRGISSGVTSNAALAYAEDRDSRSSRSDRRNNWENENEEIRSDEYTLKPSSEPPVPEWLDSWLYTYDLSTLPPSPLPPLETFRGLIVSQPLLALLTLSTLPQSDLRLIKHHELRSLMHGCNRVLRDRPVLLNRLNHDEILRSLRLLRAILFSLPSGNKKQDDQHQGKYFKGKIVKHFLGLCARVNQLRLYKSVFQDRLREHISRPEDGVMHFDGIIEDLALTYQWKLIVELFNPDSFPHHFYTPDILAYYMQAHFGIYQSTKIPRIFQLYHHLNLQPTAETYNHLIQSYLEIGDLPTAREIVREANEKGISDYATQQLAILRGYRALGFDADIENRVLNDIDKLGIPLSARLLNALIRLRMQNGDLASAKYLARKFHLSNWAAVQDVQTAHQKVKPNLATATLVFDLYSQTGDIEDLRSLWRDMKAGQVGITDQMITTLLRALNGLNLLDEAVSIFEPSLADNEWALPEGVKPDTKSFNYLIGALGRRRGLKGIQSGLELLHEYGVKPDDLTMKIVVDFVRQSVHHTPTGLANLVDRIMNSSTLKPTQTLLDSIIQNAIKTIARTKKTLRSENDLLHPSTSPNTFSPTAGLSPSPRFRKSLEGILDSLKSVDSQSGSRSLVNRLRYDSMTSARISNLPSARIVWNSLIQRGYKPDQRHFLALIQGYSDAGLMYQAQDLLGLADQVGCRITRSMLFALLVGWGKIQRPLESRRIYERIRSMLAAEHLPSSGVRREKNKKVGLEIITAMVQAYNNAGQYSEAALLCYTDLRELDIELDRRAIVVSSQALRGQGDLMGCLRVLEKYGPALDRVSRKIVRGIRNWQRKVLGLPVNSPITTDSQLEIVDLIDQQQSQPTYREMEKLQTDQEILALAEKMLRDDDIARPAEVRRMERLNGRTRRALKRSLLGEEAVQQRNAQWIRERRIYGEDGRKGRIRRRIVRSQRRVGVESRVRIGEVGERAWRERRKRRRFRRGQEGGVK